MNAVLTLMIPSASQLFKFTRIIFSQDVMWCIWSRMERYSWDVTDLQQSRGPGDGTVDRHTYLRLGLVLGLGWGWGVVLVTGLCHQPGGH